MKIGERAGAGGAAASNTHGACNDHLGAEVVAANAVGVAYGCLKFFFSFNLSSAVARRLEFL